VLRPVIVAALWLIAVASLLPALAASAGWWPMVLLFGALAAVGTWDLIQTRHSILRTYPIIGHARFLLEKIRPEIRQYFVESNTEATPFDRETRDMVYERSKGTKGDEPFGTERDVYALGYEFLRHSLRAKFASEVTPRVRIGGPDCTQPYDMALLNVSAMSFGALSGNAIEALNGGAARGGFAHDTGEGGISPYHLKPGGDLIWEIGSGYFRLPRHCGQLRCCPVRAEGNDPRGEGDFDQAVPRRQTRARWGVARPEGQRRDRGHPRSSTGPDRGVTPGTHRVLHPAGDDGVHHHAAAALRW